MDVPDDLQYTADHEWVRHEARRARIGITDYAQDALGEVIFVQLPELGAVLQVGDSLSEVESSKSVSDVYAPVAGTVIEVNSELTDSPRRLNDDPYGEGWICILQPDTEAGPRSLLDPEGYRKLIEG